jgi:hypothetical protein
MHLYITIMIIILIIIFHGYLPHRQTKDYDIKPFLFREKVNTVRRLIDVETIDSVYFFPRSAACYSALYQQTFKILIFLFHPPVYLFPADAHLNLCSREINN